MRAKHFSLLIFVKVSEPVSKLDNLVCANKSATDDVPITSDMNQMNVIFIISHPFSRCNYSQLLLMYVSDAAFPCRSLCT